MKTFKKVFAFMLAAIMMLAMTTTAFAANITIENPQTVGEGATATYKAYKIFSLVKAGEAYNYTLDNSSTAYELLKNASAEIQSTKGFSITATTVTGVYNAEVTDAPKFAEYLKSQNLTGGIDGTYDTNTKKVTINVGDALGYYFVSTNSGTLADLTTVDDQLQIYDKNEVPDIIKTSDAVNNSVEVGQIVNFTITGKVPSTTGYSKYNYIITDEMTNGLKLNATSITNNLDTSVVAVVDSTNSNKFTITFDMAAKNEDGTNKYTVGQEFTVTYTAIVTEAAVTMDRVTNTATLEYSNNPTSVNDTEEATPDRVDLYTASIIIDKVDASTKTGEGEAVTYTTHLAGAKFMLKNSEGKFYKYIAGTAETEAKVEWVAENGDPKGTPTVLETGNGEDGTDLGKVTFTGLKDGEYKLVETEAPAGYNLLTGEVSVTIAGSSDTDQRPIHVNATPVVENSKGSLLPSTGGIGTTIFYVVGGLLVAGAGILLVTRKRMSRV